MSPQPSETGRRGSLPVLEEIIKPIGDSVPHLQRWTEAAGNKVGGESTLVGFILDGDCIHPVVQIVAPSKGGLFALGGENCNDLFLITRVINGKVCFLGVNWGGTSGEQTYRITSSGFTLIEDGALGLVQGDGSGRIPTKGAALFPMVETKQPLEKKLSDLFPYSEKKKNCMFALWLGLQKAAGINK